MNPLTLFFTLTLAILVADLTSMGLRYLIARRVWAQSLARLKNDALLSAPTSPWKVHEETDDLPTIN